MATTSRRGSGSVLCSISPSNRFYTHAVPCSNTRRVLPACNTVASLPSSVRSLSARTGQSPKRACSCSPTNHPRSFRCGLHKGIVTTRTHALSPSNRTHVRRPPTTKSVVKRALAVLTRPLSHSQSRRANFKSQPSGLSIMSKASGVKPCITRTLDFVGEDDVTRRFGRFISRPVTKLIKWCSLLMYGFMPFIVASKMMLERIEVRNTISARRS